VTVGAQVPDGALTFRTGRRADRTGRAAIYMGTEDVRQPALWSELTEQEKKTCILYVVHNKTHQQIVDELRLSRSRVNQILTCAMRILRVDGQRRLGFWMGQHWQEICWQQEGRPLRGKP